MTTVTVFRRFGFAALIICLFQILGVNNQAKSQHCTPSANEGFLSVSGESGQQVWVQNLSLLEDLLTLGILSDSGLIRAFTSLHGQEDSLLLNEIQKILDPLCLLGMNINPEGRVTVYKGPACQELWEGEWKPFLVKVKNNPGWSGPISATWIPSVKDEKQLFEAKFFFRAQSFFPELQGLGLEYKLLLIKANQPGQLSGKFLFEIGQGKQDVGFKNDIFLHCDVLPTFPLYLETKDENGNPTTVSIEIKNAKGMTFPIRPGRVGADFWFQNQVYRSFGESVLLPDGIYEVGLRKGPEYRTQKFEIRIKGKAEKVTSQLNKWVDPAAWGFQSGDHHIHAAGCLHYENPLVGIEPAEILKHMEGEDLRFGGALNWAPSFTYQQQFFTGKDEKSRDSRHSLRYDIEVSGFGSHKTGHLCLLNLKNFQFPGCSQISEWPTLGLSIQKWAKSQGAICGIAHSGLGLTTYEKTIPGKLIPPFNGIGANELIMDITHQVLDPNGHAVPTVDFMAVGNFDAFAELTMWYHLLNCGYQIKIAGETDFPCLSGSEIGKFRTYVNWSGKGNSLANSDYETWLNGLLEGNAYVSDGRSHFLRFEIKGNSASRHINIPSPKTVQVEIEVAALLKEEAGLPPFDFKSLKFMTFWHIERARLGLGRFVPLELIVNGLPVDTVLILADGSVQSHVFSVPITQSSWIAARIFPASHTNPIFVEVSERPIRASFESAEWCSLSLEQCWLVKKQFYSEEEMPQVIEAYNHARKAWQQIILESKSSQTPSDEPQIEK